MFPTPAAWKLPMSNNMATRRLPLSNNPDLRSTSMTRAGQLNSPQRTPQSPQAVRGISEAQLEHRALQPAAGGRLTLDPDPIGPLRSILRSPVSGYLHHVSLG